MKILIVFIDMVRVDHLHLYNQKAKMTLLDKRLTALGGTLFTNCYTHSPDTPRSLACMQTGMLPYFNGCDTRIKWPAFFIKDEITTIWDHAVTLGFNVNLCCNENEIKTGFFKYKKSDKISLYKNIEDFFKQATFSDNSLSFIGTPDWHTAIGDYKETGYAFKKGDEIVNAFFEKFVTNEFISQFDTTIIFSDHGFQFKDEMNWMRSKLELLGNGRTQLLTFIHQKDDKSKNIREDKRLASITDIYATVETLIRANEIRQGFSLLDIPQRDILHIEDHQDFKVYPEVMIKQWRVISNNFDIRTDIYHTIDANNNSTDLDNIDLYLRSVSPKYSDYVKQLEVWKNYAQIGKDSQNKYFVGEQRIGKFAHRLISLYHLTKAYIIRKIIVRFLYRF